MNRAEKNLAKLKKADDTKLVLASILGGRCEICGYNKCLGALQFHHKDPKEKRFKLSDIQKNIVLFGYDAVVSEVKKCRLLCANCHGEYHYYSTREKWQTFLKDRND